MCRHGKENCPECNMALGRSTQHPRGEVRRPRRMSCGCYFKDGCKHAIVLCPQGHQYDAHYYGNYCPHCKTNHLVVSNDWRSFEGVEPRGKFSK